MEPTIDQPALRVVRGAPDDDELVAVTVALLGLARRAATAGGLPLAPLTWWIDRDHVPPGSWMAG